MAREHPGRHGHGRRGSHGNPEDLDACVGRLLDPGRARWQKPEAVVRALAVRRGQTIGEIGAGPGYFTLRLARAVGPRGLVYAVDVEPRMLERLVRRLARARARNVTPVLGRGDDPLLPASSCDLALIVNTYHHFPDGPGVLRRVARLLRPGGRIANIDFHRRETPVGPPLAHRIARESFLRDAGRAGLRLAGEHAFLPYQYFLVFSRRSR